MFLKYFWPRAKKIYKKSWLAIDVPDVPVPPRQGGGGVGVQIGKKSLEGQIDHL